MDGGRKEKKRKYAAERDSQVGNVLLSDLNIVNCVPRGGRRATIRLHGRSVADDGVRSRTICIFTALATPGLSFLAHPPPQRRER